MGISGLLPALKSIQVTKHLSEFAGKTIAVDAYVWLHRGVYSCATELATGKSTHKYVDYAMHRVRLLRHYGIEPYIVFDGGPLPAKKGTEKERRQKRDENRAKGHALLAQGKASLARECFIKCVDVTPQMAFQFIKALRAASVQYVVAPYEADAQLAYLERTGLVDGILTEDSDLLVFGCENVLLKLDPVEATVVLISRKDFGSVSASISDTNSISLVGWSDVQFRAMAILSGCDYLPSIPGIGLKTACSLLKKWKTAEQVIKVIAMEGKKAVPRGYLKHYRLAEKCFQHQRVYCPKLERLVHLTEIGPDWDDEYDEYVGRDIDASLAKKIALGDCDPVTHLPMNDINPNYMSRVLKPLPAVSNSPIKPSTSSNAKGKGRHSLPTPAKSGGILNFFGPNPIIPPRPKLSEPSTSVASLTGKASGKRTLAEVMEYDKEQAKRHCKNPKKTSHSKFFAPEPARSTRIHRRHSEGGSPVAGPSQPRSHGKNKENEIIVIDDDDDIVEQFDPEVDSSALSLQAQYNEDIETQKFFKNEDFPDAVEQEEGYISPSLSSPRDDQELSSPPGKTTRRTRANGQWDLSAQMIASDDDDDAFGAQAVSSPVSAKKPKPLGRHCSLETPRKLLLDTSPGGQGKILVEDTPTAVRRGSIYPAMEEIQSPTLFRGPDLRKILVADDSTELECPASQRLERTSSDSTSPPSPSPDTPMSERPLTRQAVELVVGPDEHDTAFSDDEVERAQQITNNVKTVMNGWRQKWALPSSNQSSTSVQAGKQKNRPSNAHHTPPVPPPPVTHAKSFTPGCRPLQPFNLKRSNANVTPIASRQTVAQYIPPRSAPSRLHTTTKLDSLTAVERPARSSHGAQVMDPTSEDDVDDVEEVSPRMAALDLPSDRSYLSASTRLNLSQYRYG